MNLVFQFSSFNELIAMEGHGFYVWLCYAIVFLGLIFLSLKPVIEKRNFLRVQKGIQLRMEAQGQKEE